jgi:ATP-binding cassette, subfamily B, bacterial MsbA
MRLLLRSLSYLRPYLGRQLAALACAVVVTILGLALPWVLKILIDDVFVRKSSGALAAVCVAFLAISVLSAVFGLARQYLFTQVGERASMDLRRSLFAHIQSQALQFLAREKTGKLMSHFNHDAGAVQGLYTSTLVDFVTNSLRLMVTLVVLFRINPFLAVVSLPTLPVFGFCIWAFGKPLRRTGHEVQQAMSQASETLQESLSGMREAKAFTGEGRQAQAFCAALARRLRARLRQTVLGASSSGVANITTTAGTVLVLWVGGAAVIAGDMTAGNMVAFVTYLGNLFGPTAWFVNFNVSVQTALAGADRLFQVLDTPPAVADPPDAVTLPEVRGEVCFNAVHYAYDADDVLSDISFKARPGEIFALVGPSGSGKTTMMNLIPRFADPHSGVITLDGQDIRSLTQGSLRSQIGQVFQDPFLFSGSIADNILLGRPEASAADVEAAASAANAHPFVRELPEGYDTLVGERGVRLSGGQRQRIAIARAILRNPRVLLLDEATSALDSASEAAVQEALGRLMAGRTSFVVAHRLSTVLHADCILVLDAGRLSATGTHTELLRTSPLYRDLHDRQFRNPAGVRPAA